MQDTIYMNTSFTCRRDFSNVTNSNKLENF